MGQVANKMEISPLCPLCIPSVTGIVSGLPVPARIATTLRCRGTGERITEKSGSNIPMVLPNGNIFSKKYIYENSYLKLNMLGEDDDTREFRENGISRKEVSIKKNLKLRRKVLKKR